MEIYRAKLKNDTSHAFNLNLRKLPSHHGKDSVMILVLIIDN